MAKDENEKENSEGQAKKKGKPVFLILIVGLVLLLAGGGAGAYFFLFSKPGDDKLAAEIEKDEGGHKGSGKGHHEGSSPDLGVSFDLDPFVVNLADPKARHFLKATISLELTNEEAKSEVEKRLPHIRNDIILVMGSKTIDEVITMEGKIRLKDEIAARVRRIVGEDRLTNVFFANFVVQ